MSQRDLIDHATTGGDHKMRGADGLAASDRQELESLWMIPLEKANLHQYTSCPISLQFAFLLACLSRQVLDLARKFHPLPSFKAIQSHSGLLMAWLVGHLSDLGELNGLI
jgi:hypothetical protein